MVFGLSPLHVGVGALGISAINKDKREKLISLTSNLPGRDIPYQKLAMSDGMVSR